MKKETTLAIQRFAEENDFHIDLRSEYSGRGMYGKTTYGIVADLADFIGAVALAANEMKAGSLEASDFIEDCRNFRFDHMGHGMIIY